METRSVRKILTTGATSDNLEALVEAFFSFDLDRLSLSANVFGPLRNDVDGLLVLNEVCRQLDTDDIDVTRRSLEVLFEHGACINGVDGNGRTPICYLAFNNQLRHIKFLVEVGVDLSSVANRAALFYAGRTNDSLESLAYLVELFGVIRDSSTSEDLIQICARASASDSLRVLSSMGIEVPGFPSNRAGV